MKLTKKQLLLMVQTFGQTLITLGFEKFEVKDLTIPLDGDRTCLMLTVSKIDAVAKFYFKSNPENAMSPSGYLYHIDWND